MNIKCTYAMTATRVVVPAKVIKAIVQTCRTTGKWIIAGESSVTLDGIKYLADGRCKPWPDLDDVTEFRTAGEVARIELARAFPGLKRVGWHKGDQFLLNMRPPFFYTGPREVGGYVDIKGAYITVYRRLWLDVKYPRGSGKFALGQPAGQLEFWKAARNALVGTIRTTRLVGYRGLQTVSMAVKNKFLSPELWATICAVLIDLSNEAEKVGAVYCNTDGYLFRYAQQAREFSDHLQALGIASTLVEGDGRILGWNSYTVGDRTTMLYKRGVGGGRPFDNRQQKYYKAGRMLQWWSRLA